MKINLSRRWFQGRQTAARKDETAAAAIAGAQHRAGIAGQLIADLVADLAGELIESDHAAAVALLIQAGKLSAAGRTAADLGDQQVSLNHGRAADAEEILHHAKLGFRVNLPQQLAVLHAHAAEHAVGAVDVNAVAVDDGRAARAVVVAKVIFVVGGDFKRPEMLAGFALETAQTGPVAVPVKLKQPALADAGHAVTRAEALVPHHAEVFSLRGNKNTLLRRHAGSIRTQKPRPVAAGFARAEIDQPSFCLLTQGRW